MVESQHPSIPGGRRSIREVLGAFATTFDAEFAEYLEGARDVPRELTEAIEYSALAPAKRIRPFLVIRCCELAGGRRDDAWPAAVAVECVHTFSLIHDDLPAMDNDDFRRGQPTSHKKFGEAEAILAGDALVVLAFEVLARPSLDSDLSVRMARELAAAVGRAGMIGGQFADIQGEDRAASRELTESIHRRKTARLFEASCRLGALAGGCEAHVEETLARFGQKLGRLFQIADDLLDVTGRADTIGKEVGKDQGLGKQTFPRSVGIVESRREAKALVTSAIRELRRFGFAAEDLRRLSEFALDRNY